MSVRGEVLRGLREVGPFVTYSHVLPFQYTGFIDGQAWGGVGLGSALIAGDQELADYFKNYLVSMIKMGKHTRNFAPEMVGDDWVPADVSGWFRKVKPQAFAGPCALAWANKQGADIDPKWVPDVTSMAKLYCFIAPIFKFLLSLHWGDKYWFRQHVNSVMFAHLLLDKKPPKNLKFLAKDNMVYSYIFKEYIGTDHQYPTNAGPWPAKNWPGSKVEKASRYTPLCQLCGQYMQESLRDNS